MTTTNLLVAIKNMVTNPIINLEKNYSHSNSEGKALENYIKDAFCGTLNTTDENTRNLIFSKHFSYFGNRNNPPDMMILGGDAVKVEKMQSSGSAIALNSSYPKDKFYADSPLLTEACKSAEQWVEKDLLYAVGVAPQGMWKSLWFIYGDCYFASSDTYQKLLQITDPLEVTSFNLGGCNVISPESVIRKSVAIDTKSPFLNALMLKQKYESFPLADQLALEGLAADGLSICDCLIHSPNDPSLMLKAKLISYHYPK